MISSKHSLSLSTRYQGVSGRPLDLWQIYYNLPTSNNLPKDAGQRDPQPIFSCNAILFSSKKCIFGSFDSGPLEDHVEKKHISRRKSPNNSSRKLTSSISFLAYINTARLTSTFETVPCLERWRDTPSPTNGCQDSLVKVADKANNLITCTV